MTDNININDTDVTTSVASVSDYYPFGLGMHGRTFSAEDYRYEFNGKEKDDKGEWGQTHYDYGFRIYNPQIGKFLSVDPLSKDYPWYSPYQYAGNSPIHNIDVDGLEGGKYFWGKIADLIWGSGPTTTISGSAQKLKREAEIRRIEKFESELSAYKAELDRKSAEFQSVKADMDAVQLFQPHSFSTNSHEERQLPSAQTDDVALQLGFVPTTGAILSISGSTLTSLGISKTVVSLPTKFNGWNLTGMKAGEGGKISLESVRFKTGGNAGFKYKANVGGVNRLSSVGGKFLSYGGLALTSYGAYRDQLAYNKGDISSTLLMWRHGSSLISLVPYAGPVMVVGSVMAEEGAKQMGEAVGAMEYSAATNPIGFLNWINGTNNSNLKLKK